MLAAGTSSVSGRTQHRARADDRHERGDAPSGSLRNGVGWHCATLGCLHALDARSVAGSPCHPRRGFQFRHRRIARRTQSSARRIWPPPATLPFRSNIDWLRPARCRAEISDGRFPDQSDDVKLAVRTARADPRCNGQVGAVGGSAGGYQSAFTPPPERYTALVHDATLRPASGWSKSITSSPKGWLPRKDSNLDKEIQNLSCYHYTTRHRRGTRRKPRSCSLRK